MDFTTTSDMTGESFSASDYEGKLVLVTGATKDLYDGDWGQTEISVCDLLVVLDADEGPAVFTNTWVFGAALAPTLNRTNGKPFLGRIVKGEAKGGRNAPWIFQDADDTDKTAAAAWAEKFLTKGVLGAYEYIGNPSDPTEAPF